MTGRCATHGIGADAQQAAFHRFQRGANADQRDGHTYGVICQGARQS